MRERPGLLAGLVLIALVNGVILAGVAWNRSAVEAQVELTERELDFHGDLEPDEDSGLSLRLHWEDGREWPAPGRLDREKLREIGFDVRIDPADPKAAEHYRSALARKAFMVLQMEGDAWRQRIAKKERHLDELKADSHTRREEIENAQNSLDADRRMGSRLIAVDAGLDPQGLRARYPDRSRYLILPARFDLQFSPMYENRPAHLFGTVELLVAEVHVPLELRPLLDAVRRQRNRESSQEGVVQMPLFRAAVAVGRRYEPRLVSVGR